MEKSASTPQPPYYAVIFTSLKVNNEGYDQASERMFELVSQLDGFLGFESFRNDNGFGVTISYWRNLDDIKGWKNNFEHLFVQKNGRESWYKHYKVRICRVERDYEFNN